MEHYKVQKKLHRRYAYKVMLEMGMYKYICKSQLKKYRNQEVI